MLGAVSNLRGFKVSDYIKKTSYRGFFIPEDVRLDLANIKSDVYKNFGDVLYRRDMPEPSPLEMLTPQLRPLINKWPKWEEIEIEDLWNDIFINARTKIKTERSGNKRLVFVTKKDGKEGQVAAGKVVWNCMNPDNILKGNEKLGFLDNDPLNCCYENLFYKL